MKKIHLFTLSAALLLGSCWSVAQAAPTEQEKSRTIYLSPTGDDTHSGDSPQQSLKTLPAAQAKIRSLKQQGALTSPVVVQLQSGVYPIHETLRFTPEDSGTELAPITYYAAPGDAAVLNGGKAITGWRKYKNNVWVTTLPDVKSGAWNFKQLYVNGELRTRARTPNTGVFTVKGTPGITFADHSNYRTPSDHFEFSSGDINPKWKNPTNGEVILYHFWVDNHLQIESIDGKTNIIRFKNPSLRLFWDGFEGDKARYIVENLYEAMDQPGEWMLDYATGELFYIPMEGEVMGEVEVIAPYTQTMISFQGDLSAGRWVENIRFDGLQVFYSNFVLPPGKNNDLQASSDVEAAIVMDGVRSCEFTRCTLRNLGGHAFDLVTGCTENRFTYNTIEQIGGGGFRLQGVTPGENPALRTGNNTISDNTVGYYGRRYASAVGIFAMHSDNNLFSHNWVHHGDYTGISVGWSWGYRLSSTHNNRIEDNLIHDIGYNNLLSDMGGIYTLGLSPGTVLRGNLIYNVNANRYGGWGIYMDEGSTSILIENNIVYNTKFGTFNIHYAKDIIVRNNIFAMAKLEQITRERVEPHVSVYFEGNIVYWKEGKFMAQDWFSKKERPFYAGYFAQPETADETTVMDWNLYYNPTKQLGEVEFNGHTWDEWHALGKDLHSVYADPMFIDAENHDFRLREGSPALKLGFTPIDMSEVGPRVKK